MTEDKLHWWEEIPLALATIAQSVVVGMWYYKSIHLGEDWLNIMVAIIAGLALDLIVVTTVMGRRMGRDSGWSNGSAFGAFLCSALIAVDTYSTWLEWVRPLLHVSYPLMVLLYSQHLAGVRKQAPDVAATIMVDLVQPTTTPQVAPQSMEQHPQLTSQAVAQATEVDTLTTAIEVPTQPPRKQVTSPLAGVDVVAELRDRFDGSKARMAKHYGVSRQAIDNRVRG